LNSVGALFTVVAILLMLALPTRLAALPLLLAALCMPSSQEIQVAGANFTVLRILVFVGFLRVLARGEVLPGGLSPLDKLVLLWALLLVGTSAFHTSDAWVYRLGIVWGEVGCYFLLRVFLATAEDVTTAFRFVCWVVLPLGVLMLLEKATGQNPFGFLGAFPVSLVRDGHVRATGPFAHPISAGTVGAVCAAIGIYMWRRSKLTGLAGLLGSLGMVFAATSSGPILMTLSIALGVMFWPLRRHMNRVRQLALAAVVGLAVVMKDPVYFLIARIDITGGSQGYFRAQLIRSSIEHLDEWWLVGTDYTRHWMASGIYANERHTDIVNHYLAMGVLGGLPLLFLFTLIVVAAFASVGRALAEREREGDEAFLAWLLGAMVFGHVVNFVSTSLFDQPIVFFYLPLAAICAYRSQRQHRAPSGLQLSHPESQPMSVRP
jgi:hypothetical protein